MLSVPFRYNYTSWFEFSNSLGVMIQRSQKALFFGKYKMWKYATVFQYLQKHNTFFDGEQNITIAILCGESLIRTLDAFLDIKKARIRKYDQQRQLIICRCCSKVYDHKISNGMKPRGKNCNSFQRDCPPNFCISDFQDGLSNKL